MPKFKIGDKVRFHSWIGIINSIQNDYYFILLNNNEITTARIKSADQYFEIYNDNLIKDLLGVKNEQ